MSDDEEDVIEAPVPPYLDHIENDSSGDVTSDVDGDDDASEEGLDGVAVEEGVVQKAAHTFQHAQLQRKQARQAAHGVVGAGSEDEEGHGPTQVTQGTHAMAAGLPPRQAVLYRKQRSRGQSRSTGSGGNPLPSTSKHFSAEVGNSCGSVTQLPAEPPAIQTTVQRRPSIGRIEPEAAAKAAFIKAEPQQLRLQHGQRAAWMGLVQRRSDGRVLPVTPAVPACRCKGNPRYATHRRGEGREWGHHL